MVLTLGRREECLASALESNSDSSVVQAVTQSRSHIGLVPMGDISTPPPRQTTSVGSVNKPSGHGFLFEGGGGTEREDVLSVTYVKNTC
jgi:hypothetical protein